MFKEVLEKIMTGHDLEEEEMYRLMHRLMSGEFTPAQIAGFLVALRMKGETVSEITGAARAMREKAERLEIDGEVIDTCGTGGDAKGTFNVSTATAFVVAGAGLKVAKHGNRSVSSQCGSADVLEALGVRIDLPPAGVKECIERVGIGFLFAPKFHPAMKYATPPRRELGIRTIFNLLGPLTNPACATYQLMGVYDAKWLVPLAEVLKKLSLKAAMVVHGEGGYDEITVTGPTKIAEFKDGEIKTYEISPEKYGLKPATAKEIKGGNKEESAQLMRELLAGKKQGAYLDMVLLNAAGVFKITGKASSWEEGIELGREVINTGKALEKLEALIEISQAWKE
jgi:anthranilate phosphoribosyltransferase